MNLHPTWPDHPLDGMAVANRYRLALSEIQDKLETYQFLLANHRRKIEELTTEAEQLEDQCRPIEDRIDSLQDAIRALGGAA